MSVNQTSGKIKILFENDISDDFNLNIEALARTQADGARQLKFSGNMDLETNKIVNVTDPTGNQEIATKAYVDAGGGGGGGASAGLNTQIQYNNNGSFGAGAGFVFDGSGNVTATKAVNVDRIGIAGQKPNEIRTNNNISLRDLILSPKNNDAVVCNSDQHVNPERTAGSAPSGNSFIHGTNAEPKGYGRLGQDLMSSGNFSESTTVYQTTSITYCKHQTTGDSTANIYPGGMTSYDNLEIPYDSHVLFDYSIVASTDNGTAAGKKAWRYYGVLKNENGTGSFVGTPTKTVIADDSIGGLDVNVVLSNNSPSTGSLGVILKGIQNATTMTNWCANLDIIEVRGDASSSSSSVSSSSVSSSSSGSSGPPPGGPFWEGENSKWNYESYKDYPNN